MKPHLTLQLRRRRRPGEPGNRGRDFRAAMESPEYQDRHQRASQVCSHCKSIKKGCDKKIPRCGQCVRRNATCCYDYEVQKTRYQPLTPPVEASEQGCTTRGFENASTLSNLNSQIKLSFFLASSLAESLPPIYGISQASTKWISTANVFRSQVCHIIEASGTSAADATSRYFSTVHPWLPIIASRRFYQRFSGFPEELGADFWILVLAMRLICELPPTIDEGHRDSELLYQTTKQLFSQVQAVIPSSLELVQSGVILSRYEYGHGMLQASYITVGTTGRMASMIGLHSQQCSRDDWGNTKWIQDEERLATWWGLVSTDRNIGIHPKMRDKPLATRITYGEDHIPLNPIDLESVEGDNFKPHPRYVVSTLSPLPVIESFGREAQAIYLLDKVLIMIETFQHTDQLKPIAFELRNLLEPVMEQTGGRCGLYCGAVNLLITGLYIVQDFASLQPLERECVMVVQTTFEVITRIIVDVVHGFALECNGIDVRKLAPVFMHVVRGAQRYIATTERDTPQWNSDMQAVKNLFRVFGRRWALAGIELKALNI